MDYQTPPQFAKICDTCHKAFSCQRSLKNHINKVHPKRIFTCPHCNRAVKSKFNLDRHMKSHLVPKQREMNHICPMCSHRTCNRKRMLDHYEMVHDVSIAPKEFKFNNYDEFSSWKTSLQKTDRCSYVADGGPHKSANKIVYYFKCFRDGYYVGRGGGKRRLKIRGSCKINGICPSAICCSLDRHSGVVDVRFIAAHVGHEADVGRLNLSKEERGAIARKIAANVPFDVILDDFKELSDMGIDCEVTRAHLLTRKDLWNIKQSFNLNTQKGHSQQSTRLSDPLEELTDGESAPLSPPSTSDDNSSQRSCQHDKDFDAEKEELRQELIKMVEAASDRTHLDIIRRNMRPSIPMMEAAKSDFRFK